MGAQSIYQTPTPRGRRIFTSSNTFNFFGNLLTRMHCTYYVAYFLRRLTLDWRRVGFQETSTTLILPQTVSQLHTSWDVMAKLDNTTVWDFLWDSKVDENREKGLLQTAFTANCVDIPITCA